LIYKPIENNYFSCPNKIALIDDNRKYSYTELWLDIIKIATWYDNILDQTDNIGVMLDNTYNSVASIYAVGLSGRIFIPIDTDSHKNNIQYIIKDASVRLIITSVKYVEKIIELKLTPNPIIVLDKGDTDDYDFISVEDIKKNNEGKSIDFIPNEDELSLATIFYTTGTTGPKKGVMLTHLNLNEATKNINSFMKISSCAIESLPMRLSHSFGFARLRCVFDVGGSIILENGFLRPEKVLNNIKIHFANAISSVPMGFIILLDYYKEPFLDICKQINYIEIGSSQMDIKYKRLLINYCSNAKIFMHYGLTEASRASFIEFHSSKHKLDTVGKPSPNTQIFISDDNGKMVSKNKVGEIVISGKMVFKGYLNNPNLTGRTLKNDFMYTRDIGFIDDDGYLNLLGRKDDIINVGGLKVSPLEVENILVMFTSVKEAVVVGVDSQESLYSQKIKAYIVSDDDHLSINKIKKFCLDNLEPYKVPSEFELIDSIPKTASGKIMRNKLSSKKESC